MKMIFALAASLAVLAAPAALANGQKQQVVRSNEPVPAGDQQAAARFNRCISNEYSSKSNRTPAINDAMGRYRDTYTLVTRAITANNLPEFRRHLRDAQIQAVEVGTTCTL